MAISDVYQALIAKAQAPVKRPIRPLPLSSASHKLTDGRRVTCTCRRDSGGRENRCSLEWYIDGIAVDGVVAKVALANFS
jgi:hypothetical protein